MKKILLVGKGGQVGWELRRTLATLGEVVAVDRQEMDLASPDSIRNVIRATRPDWIVNAAAYTAVDKAESESDLAMAINGIAPGIMAEEAKRLGAAMVHYSTDYVFDGTKGQPRTQHSALGTQHSYTEEDAPSPLGIYGRTKLAGDLAIQSVGIPHLIFRTSWVYGLRGRNFLLTILRLAKERDELRIVDDQVGAPTWSRMIAEATAQVLSQCGSFPTEKSGIYNLAAAGSTSWHGFAQAILEMAAQGSHPSPNLIPIATAEYPLPAPRPPYSVLSCAKLDRMFGVTLPAWGASLALCMEQPLSC